MHGFYRVATAVNQTTVANPKKNAIEILKLLQQANEQHVAITLFPELTLTGYTASDLFLNQTLIQQQHTALASLLISAKELSTVAVIGFALIHQNRLYNTALIFQNGKILGIVPKSYLPNKKEFYEKRHFNSGIHLENQSIQLLNQDIPFGTDLLFQGQRDNEILFGVEICEDLWAITPPSNQMAINGANIIFNLSASNELIAKAQYRKELVRTQSARCMSAYVYASSGVGESTTDTVYGGHAIIAEYGSILNENRRFERKSHLITADIDVQKLHWLRINESSYAEHQTTDFRTITFQATPSIKKLQRFIPSMPFVPSKQEEKRERANEIINIQAHALIKRMEHTQIKKAIIGISGGLDSTLALLATHKAFEIMQWKYANIIAITMPGFGTTSRTKNNAIKLCNALEVTLRTIEIKTLSLSEFEAIGHDINDYSVTYENVQARARTSILMNTANREGGLVIGTGDLSEIALGWSTYNGDHMSMYALNVGIPKTLIQYVIESFTDNQKISSIINDILKTPISPELLPPHHDKITQETESIIGPYELHDFFLYHFLKYGASPSKILFLANHAFEKYEEEEIRKWLKKFIWRFFTQQFKRSCMPDGPKIGSISLSPRADWKMPSDADVKIWLEAL